MYKIYTIHSGFSVSLISLSIMWAQHVQVLHFGHTPPSGRTNWQLIKLWATNWHAGRIGSLGFLGPGAVTHFAHKTSWLSIPVFLITHINPQVSACILISVFLLQLCSLRRFSKAPEDQQCIWFLLKCAILVVFVPVMSQICQKQS